MNLDIPKAHAEHLLRQMILVRRFEEKAAEMYSEQKIRGFLHLAIGEEAVSVGAMNGLSEDDNVIATYREHGHALARGLPSGAVMAELFGKTNGCSGGRGGSMHIFSAEKRFYGGHAIVAGHLPVATGLALADRLRNEERVTACFFGDGAVDEGEFHESLNLAALWKLPVLFVCENNQYAMGTPLSHHQADVELVHKPAAYGIVGEAVDGMDVLAVERAVHYARDAIRTDGMPRFLELRTYRFRAHSMYDAELYREKSEVEEWRKRDPILLFQQRMIDAGYLDDSSLAATEESVLAEVSEAVAFAEAGEWEPVADLARDVYAPESP